MPQDDTFVTPTTPTPTTPVQDDTSDQNWGTPAPADTSPVGVLPIDVPASSPVSPAPVDTAPIDTTPVDSAPVDPITSSPAYVAPIPPADQAPAAGPALPPVPDAANVMPAISPASADIYTEVAVKINDSKNVLIALSSDPSVDELSAAIGLSLYLDRIGKRATAIYSGATPNALEFLKPEETFETSADTLQDFVIALNKEKADHLRYKLDGDYVKVYITPYKHRLSQDDLEFSYGDYNVDLVIALDVANGIDLDAALREHGRIMHDAVIVNATTGNPGKFGEIEWSDKTASSVSEMIATLLYNFGGEDPIAKDEATAYLTGIVAATNRFANAKTTPATMRLCSKLMESGANQQLVSKNITPDIDNELIGFAAMSRNTPTSEAAEEEDPTKLDIEHGDEEKGKQSSGSSTKSGEISTEVTKKEHTLLDDLKAAEQSLAQASAETVPDDNGAALEIDSHSSSDGVPEIVADKSSSDMASADSTSSEAESSNVELSDTKSSDDEPSLPELPTVDTSVSEPSTPDVSDSEPTVSNTPSDAGSSDSTTSDTSSDTDSSDSGLADKPETVVAPSSDFDKNDVSEDDTAKYGQMLQDALDSINSMPAEPATAIMSQPDPDDNPALASAPSVPANPEINGVPEMNFMPMPGTEILPPPPAPPISMPQDSTSQDPTLPVAGSPTTPLGPQPAMQDQVYRPQASDPGAFKIPGM